MSSFSIGPVNTFVYMAHGQQHTVTGDRLRQQGAWDAETVYNLWDVVAYSNGNYVSLWTGAGETPGAYEGQWSSLSQLYPAVPTPSTPSGTPVAGTLGALQSQVNALISEVTALQSASGGASSSGVIQVTTDPTTDQMTYGVLYMNTATGTISWKVPTTVDPTGVNSITPASGS